ncbi:MAG: hypothetical protein WD342_08305 [Verrucomicrobiales bacterium]
MGNLFSSCREQGDLEAMSRIRQLSDTLGMPRGPSRAEEWAGHHYRSALRAIEAGQTRMAAQSLHATLRTGSALVLTERAEELLDQLEKDHPEECRRALATPFVDATTHGVRGNRGVRAAVRVVLSGEQTSKEVEQIRKPTHS